MKKLLPLAGTVCLFVLEWWLLHRLVASGETHPDRQKLLCWQGYCLVEEFSAFILYRWQFFSIPILLWLFLGYRYFQTAKTGDPEGGFSGTTSLLQAFIRIVKAEVGTLVGVVNLLFILFNIAWTQDLLLEAVKDGQPYAYPIFTGLFLVVPFVWSRPTRAKPQRIPVESRKFLIAGLSYQGSTPDSNPNFFSKAYPGWCSNWEPIRACLEVYPRLERVLIVHSKETYQQANVTFLAAIEENFDKGEVHSFRELIQKSVHPDLLVMQEILPDQNDFNRFFPQLKNIIKGYIRMYGYRDEEVIFSITGGTAVLSAGLTFLSMPGRRGSVYSRQDYKLSPIQRLEEFEVNIYTIDELWKEITEQVSGE